VSFDLLNLSVLNPDAKLDRLATDLAVFDIFLISSTDVHKEIEALRTIRADYLPGLFHANVFRLTG
jgi:hypothetical protein